MAVIGEQLPRRLYASQSHVSPRKQHTDWLFIFWRYLFLVMAGGRYFIWCSRYFTERRYAVCRYQRRKRLSFESSLAAYRSGLPRGQHAMVLAHAPRLRPVSLFIYDDDNECWYSRFSLSERAIFSPAALKCFTRAALAAAARQAARQSKIRFDEAHIYVLYFQVIDAFRLLHTEASAIAVAPRRFCRASACFSLSPRHAFTAYRSRRKPLLFYIHVLIIGNYFILVTLYLYSDLWSCMPRGSKSFSFV